MLALASRVRVCCFALQCPGTALRSVILLQGLLVDQRASYQMSSLMDCRISSPMASFTSSFARLRTVQRRREARRLTPRRAQADARRIHRARAGAIRRAHRLSGRAGRALAAALPAAVADAVVSTTPGTVGMSVIGATVLRALRAQKPMPCGLGSTPRERSWASGAIRWAGPNCTL